MDNQLNNKIIDCIQSYSFNAETDKVSSELEKIKSSIPEISNEKVYRTMFNVIDLTTLNVTDNGSSIVSFVNKVNQFSSNFPGIDNVAAICTWPSLAAKVREVLTAQGVSICVVSAGFPDWHTFPEVKVAETSLAVMDGAEEIDIVINVGDVISGNYDTVFDDISEVKAACGSAKLKVILESGIYGTLEQVKTAAIIAMEAGADFIKTSTGKVSPAATPEAFYVMAQAVKAFNKKSGKKIGLKPAGGISTTDDALIYYAIVKEVLGDEWLNNKLFRIGTSRLANDVLGRIVGKEVKYF